MYELDPVSWDVLNFQQYHMNMTRCNAEGHITWELFYDAKELWNIPDLTPQSWQVVRVVCVCVCDSASERLFIGCTQVSDAIGAESNIGSLYQYVLNTAVFPAQPCDALCMRMSKCETASASFASYSKCLLLP